MWSLPATSRVQLREDCRAFLQHRLAEKGRRGSLAYRRLRKTTHSGTARSTWAGSPTLRQLRAWGREFRIPLPDLEAGVTYCHNGVTKQGLMGPFPRHPDSHWAFLCGLYMGCGAIYRREGQVRFRVDDTVVPLLQQELAAAGLEASFRPARDTPGRTVCILSKAATPWLRQLGLPLGGPRPRRPGRGRTGRIERLCAPSLARTSPDNAKAFVEGLLNTSAFQPFWIETEGVERVSFQVHLVSPSRAARSEVADLIEATLAANGVTGLRRYHDRRDRRTFLHGVGYQRFLALARCFRLRRRRALDALDVRGRR